jgi:excinuclease UvrABC nuclease subunit
MKVEELNPTPKHRINFKFSSFKLVPKNAGCYVLTTFDTEILYLGLSDNLFNRFQEHLDNSEKRGPTTQGKAIWFYYAIWDKKNLPQLERTWINNYISLHGRLPILNKVNSPVS